MKPFEIDRFMFNIHHEAGELYSFSAAEWKDIPYLFRLHGERFVQAAYFFVLGRAADDSGLSQYMARAESVYGKLRILLSLYLSSEKRCKAAQKAEITAHNLRRTQYTIAKPRDQQQNTDAFYCAFENRFREDFDTILERIEGRYSAALEQARSVGKLALDLGCGRGEGVAFFGAHGFQASGVDSSRIAVKSAQERGLNVAIGDLFAHLAAQKSRSLAVVSAFHVIEHLPFEQLMKLADEAWRVLRPNGLLILETPNARNLLVTGGDFYRDPTHIRPIFPDTLDFLLQGSGFEGQAYFFDADERRIPAAEARLSEIEDYFRISRDMAWVGRKTPNQRGW